MQSRIIIKLRFRVRVGAEQWVVEKKITIEGLFLFAFSLYCFTLTAGTILKKTFSPLFPTFSTFSLRFPYFPKTVFGKIGTILRKSRKM